MPANLESWLFDQSSLTARLVALSKGDFHVQVLSQQWQKMHAEEAGAMGIAHVQTALIRRVLLVCCGKPVVYARTVIPSVTVSGAQRRYANMGKRPLGAMLFSDRTMHREPVMVSKLPASSRVFSEYRRDCNIENAAPNIDRNDIWGRRSVFRVSNKPLLVSEYFLPALFEV